MTFHQLRIPNRLGLSLTILAGMLLRLCMAAFGHNYDVDSFLIVARVMEQGGTVYAETTRYNYGPIWFYVLHGLYFVSSENAVTFRWLLTLFLSFVDLGIFLILLHTLGQGAGYFFWFNPISIIITGYHSQFDNLAILLGMIGALLLEDQINPSSVHRRKLLGTVMIGLSLVTKHLFFIFPLWLAVKQRGWAAKGVTLLLPILIFLSSFAPFWRKGHLGIVNNVFFYQSRQNEFFYKLFVPDILRQFLTSQMLWILLLVIFGFVFRNKSGIQSVLLYTTLLVAASPALANQYLAIAVPFLAANPNAFSVLYTVLGTLHLALDRDGLWLASSQDLLGFGHETFYVFLTLMLTASFLWASFGGSIRKSANTALVRFRANRK